MMKKRTKFFLFFTIVLIIVLILVREFILWHPADSSNSSDVSNKLNHSIQTPQFPETSIQGPAQGTEKDGDGGANQKSLSSHISNEEREELWRKVLEAEMKRFQPEGTAITINSKGHYRHQEGSAFREVEHVQIITRRPDGKEYSFDASVDNKTGEILSTWNKVIAQ